MQTLIPCYSNSTPVSLFSTNHHFTNPNSISPANKSTAFNAVNGGDGENAAAKGSGTTARGRRLLRLREEKQKREFDRLHNYPAWAKVLEDACKNDAELRAVLGDSVGNPELMRKKVEERVRIKGRDFQKSKTGSVVAFKVSFRDFNPMDAYIWVELFGSPTDRDVYLFGSVIQAWYVMGRLGAFNSSNLQITGAGFDLGTSDVFAIDVLLNNLTVLSSEYLGIKQVVFGGRKLGDWEEGMISPEYGYKSFKI